MPATSDPAPGSVIPMAAISSPFTKPGSQRPCCSGSGQLGQVGQADVVVYREAQSDSTAVGVHERLDQNLVVAVVAGVDAAEVFVGREAKQPNRTGLREHLARDDA